MATLRKALMDANQISRFGQVREIKYNPVYDVVEYDSQHAHVVVPVDELEIEIQCSCTSVPGFAH